MKILITILAFINGGYMLLDGFYVLFKGKYIGPEKPGPWANLFHKLQVDVFKLGPMFIVLGIVWLIFLFGLLNSQPWSYKLGLIISILTLWYLPAGTVISLVILILLLTARSRIFG